MSFLRKFRERLANYGLRRAMVNRAPEGPSAWSASSALNASMADLKTTYRSLAGDEAADQLEATQRELFVDIPQPRAKRFWFYGPERSWRSWTRRSSWFGRGSDEFANRTVYLCTPFGGVVVVTERHLSHLLDDPASHMNNAQWLTILADMLAEVAQEDGDQSLLGDGS